MAAIKSPSLRTCTQGHNYYKTSDCPTCPICEQDRRPESGFLSLLSAPARRALEKNNITTPMELSQRTLKEVLAFHGMGKASIRTLQAHLKETGHNFKDE